MDEKLVQKFRACRRINVVGTSGSGKSTFSAELAERLSLPYYSMDQLYWKPNWQEPANEEFATIVEGVVNEDKWVLDGNYHSKTHRLKWARAEAVIWLDFSALRTLQQIVQRSVARIRSGEEVWPNTGNVETFRRTFLSHESVILWSITSRGRVRRRYQQCMDDSAWQHLLFICLASRKETAKFLDAL